MAAPSEYAEPARQFRDGDYQVETAFLAVPAALSRLGILSRFQAEVEAYGHGRYIDPAVHDVSYQGVLQAAADLDREGLSDNVFVFRRDARVVYQNHRSADGSWQDPPSTAEAIQQERERPWSQVEGRRFLAQAQSLEGRLDPGLQNELLEIRRLALPLLPADLQPSALPARAAPPAITAPETRLEVAARVAAVGHDREALLQGYRERSTTTGDQTTRPADGARRQADTRRREEETRRPGPDQGPHPRL